MKAVFLDYRDINFGDLSWDAFEDICSFEAYSESTMEEAVERARDAEAVITDSLTLDESFMRRCPHLKFIGAAATGYNNIDIEAAGRLGIAVANVPEYSREAVAQHTIALLLDITNRVSVFEEGRMTEDPMKGIPTLLHGKTLGIVGFGSIGSKVAEIGEALGMKVNIYSRDKEAAIASDVVSLHCPLNEETAGLVDREFISKMKDGAILINTARGGLVDEEALANHTTCGIHAGRNPEEGAGHYCRQFGGIHQRTASEQNCVIFWYKQFRRKDETAETGSYGLRKCGAGLWGNAP